MVANLLPRIDPVKQRLAPAPAYYLIASTAFITIFGLVPSSLYLHSGETWNFDAYLLFVLAGIGLVLYAVAAVAIRLLAARYPRAAANAAIALFCLGLFALLAHVYAPIQIGPLDGTGLVSDEPIAYSIVEIGLLGLLALIFVFLSRGRGLGMASAFAGFLLVVSAGYLAVVASAGQRELSVGEVRAADLPTPPGNVYHIVLDMLDTRAFLSSVERLGLADHFSGFDLFQNNISNYITTLPSSASYFSGTFYHSEPYAEWIGAWQDRGLFESVANHGYSVWMYSPFAHWNRNNIQHFVHHLNLYEEAVGVDNARFYDFSQIWLASLAPNALTNEALRAAGAVRDDLFALIAGKKLLSVSEGVEPYASLLMLQRLHEDEDRRTADGHYVYAHAVLPHGPEVLDGECRYVGKPRPRRSPPEVRRAILEQTDCALTVVTDFLAQLKELGRYDPATIVLHADNGHWTAFPVDDANQTAPRTLGAPNAHLLSRVHALLMIKPPYAEGPLRVHDTPTQLVDLFPTLLDVLDLEPPDYPMHGRSVYALSADDRREARFGFDPKDPYGPDIVEIQIEDPMDPAGSDLTVIGRATEPSLWRREIREPPPAASGSGPGQ